MGNIKILIVDDDEKILFAFRQVLSREGYISIEADSGSKALDLFDIEQPNVVFLDLILPDLNGLEVLKRIKEKNNSTPVIIITGEGNFHVESKANALGAFEYLAKPLSLAQVREVIHRALIFTGNLMDK